MRSYGLIVSQFLSTLSSDRRIKRVQHLRIQSPNRTMGKDMI